MVEAGAGQNTGSCMLPKIEDAILLFINIRKWAGLLLTSGLLHNFTQIKVKDVCLTERALHLVKNYPSHLKMLI